MGGKRERGNAKCGEIKGFLHAKFDPESLCLCLFLHIGGFSQNQSHIAAAVSYFLRLLFYSARKGRRERRCCGRGANWLQSISPPPLFSILLPKKRFSHTSSSRKGGYIRKTLEDEKGRMTVREEKEIAGFALLLLLFTLSRQQAGKRSSTFHRKTKIFL